MSTTPLHKKSFSVQHNTAGYSRTFNLCCTWLGIALCYFGTLYAMGATQGRVLCGYSTLLFRDIVCRNDNWPQGIQPCYFWVVYTTYSELVVLVYNPDISGLYTPTCKVKRPSSMVYTPAISGPYIPNTGIFSSPKVPVSSLT